MWINFRRDSFATFDDWEEVCELAGVDPHDCDLESITIDISKIEPEWRE